MKKYLTPENVILFVIAMAMLNNVEHLAWVYHSIARLNLPYSWMNKAYSILVVLILDVIIVTLTHYGQRKFAGFYSFMLFCLQLIYYPLTDYIMSAEFGKFFAAVIFSCMFTISIYYFSIMRAKIYSETRHTVKELDELRLFKEKMLKSCKCPKCGKPFESEASKRSHMGKCKGNIKRWRYDFVPEYKALHFQNTITMIRDTDFKLPTEPGMNYTACYQQPFIVAWWSAGITSTVACKIALELYQNVELYYIEIDTAHEDNARFKAECERWYGCEIKTLKSKEFNNQFEVIEKTGAVNTPTGAPCTLHLKKNVRFDFERLNELSLFNTRTILNQVWGYEYEPKEINRGIRHLQQYPATKPLFPLIEKGLTKEMCAGLLLKNGIELPEMYKLGYSNNNCIGCVKGGKGYWNKIRVDFPNVFDRMKALERKVGYSCINGLFLDELTPEMGRMKAEIMPSCGNICDVEFADIPDKNLQAILSGSKSIYEAVL